MIVYSRYNSGRKKEFRLLTTIEKSEDGTLFSSKRAQVKEAIPFLNSLILKHNLLEKNNFSVKPLKFKKSDDSKINFEFSHHKSLANLLLQALVRKDRNGFLEIVEEYVKVIRKNKISKQPLSGEFQKIFGEYCGEDMECLRPGCLDLNFDNMRYDDKNSSYYLLDYEWTFDFPIPYKYVIFRALNDFYYKNRAYNPHEIVRLDELLNHFNIQEKEIFISFEYNFQKFVLGENLKQSLESYKKYLDMIEKGNYFRESQEFTGFDQIIQKKDFEIQQKSEETNKLSQEIQQKDAELQAKDQVIRQKDIEIRRKDQRINNLGQEIKSMKASKFWKLRGKYIKLREKLRLK